MNYATICMVANRLVGCLVLCMLIILGSSKPGTAQLKAFPEAEGFGRFATGGRNGTVYRVTNLNNAGPGSLRDAVSQPNRIVVFTVAGVIRITERMVVAPNIYIAGQTAPGEGITVYGNGWSFSNAHNTICRYIRIRMGVGGSSGADALGIADGRNMIFDHCSVSWGRDENFSINSSTAENITIQNCIISQGLLSHSAGGLIQAPGGITLYRNLYVDNSTRNHKIKGINQYVNNVVYNWQNGAYIMGGDSQGESFANAVGNLFIQGPVNGTSPFSGANALYHLYEEDNLHDNNRNGQLDPYVIPRHEFAGGPDFRPVPYNYPALPTVPANTLFNHLLPEVGASLPYRDYADYYVLNEVKTLGKRGEFIGREDVMPFGAPTAWNLWAGNARTDNDADGIPDDWELVNGLNPNSATDAMQIASNGYTHIENYINGINASHSQPYLRAPLNLRLDSATQNTLHLSWYDYTEQEDGYIIERKQNGSFVQIGTTPANVNVFTVSGMLPEQRDTFRVRAFNTSMQSGNSNELIARTKPVEVLVVDPDAFVPDLTWTGINGQSWDKTSMNWRNSSNLGSVYTDNAKVLFEEAGLAGQNINLAEPLAPGDVLFKSAGNYTLQGVGLLTGTGSVNKTGAGFLTLTHGNTYTGATVLHQGTLSFSQLANGEQPSSIGASPNYGFNWVWKGGTWQYTGGNTSTDRAAVLDKTSAFSVSNAASTVTFMGELSGTGGLIKEGPGKLTLRRSNTYEGPTTIRGGVLEIVPTSAATEAENIIHNGTALGASNQLYFEGGTFRTSSGSTTIYENYPMNFYIKEGTINGFEPYRNANLMMNVYGGGTLNYAITYSRELIQGDWTGFTGTLVANGVGTLTGGERPMLMIDNGVGMPNARIHATGNTKITCYSNNQTIYFGGLTGTSSTTLACGNRLAGGAITWVIGGAATEETDETFEGVINNEVYLNSTTTGTTSLIKEGLGTWRLTNNNPYAGTTTIEGGRLVINGQKTGAGAVLVQQGALAGTGSVAGDVTVAGGVLSPGDGAIGTLTLKANCTLQEAAVVELGLNRAAAQWDKINVEGNMIYNGILRISANGTLAAGDAFKIFNVSGNVSGSFTSIEPAQPGPGLEWQFYPATGVLMVTEPGFVMAPSALALSAGVMPPPDPKVFVTLAWTDNSDNEEHFVIERSTDGHNFFPVGQAAANSSSFTDEDGLLENTEYYYRVKATGLTKESGYSNVASVTTPLLAAPPGLPATPQPVHNAENVMLTNGNLLLQWTGTGNTEQYSVYFGTQPDNLVLLGIVPHSANPQILAIGLQPNTIWYWQVMAANSNGTTVGTLWQFKTAGVPALMPGDYRTVSSGNWGSSAVATNVWETWNGTSWEPTTELPGSNTNTITIRSGHTLSLNATTAATNLVIENGATLRSGLADGATGSAANRNLRVRKGIANFGTFGSSSTAAERINIEIFAANGTVNISGTNRLNVANFNVNPLAEVLEVVIDVDMNLSGYMRSYYSTTPSGTPSQDDDEVTITISQGKTVTIGSSGYLQVGSSPTTNTMEQFGRYTYNIAGTLDMRSTGTSCIVAHSTKASSKTTINVSGRWLTGNAMRLVSAATTVPTGQVEFNITGNGVVDAAARTIGGSGATNLVQANGTTGQAIPFNIAGNGQLRQRVANSNVVYHVATAGIYSPVRLNNAGTAGIFEVGLQTHFDNAVGNTDRMVNRQYNIAPVNAPGANLTIGLGWVAQAQGSLFSVSDAVSIYHHNSGAWQPKEATISGGGTMASPYYATATGYTNFSPFAVGNTDASLPVTLVTFIGKPHDGGVLLQFTTAMEINLKAYQIERSINGTRFETITQISAKPGNGGSQHYVHKDSKAPSGTLYYRLKIIDRDGAYSYSHTIAVKQHESYQPLHVFPNPAKSTINLSHAQAGRNALVKVLDGAGKLVITQRLATGSTLSSLAIGKLPQGIYTIVLVDNVTSTLRFVKE